MPKHSEKYTLMFAAIVTITCSIILASAATLLKDKQVANVAFDKRKNNQSTGDQMNQSLRYALLMLLLSMFSLTAWAGDFARFIFCSHAVPHTQRWHMIALRLQHIVYYNPEGLKKGVACQRFGSRRIISAHV